MVLNLKICKIKLLWIIGISPCRFDEHETSQGTTCICANLKGTKISLRQMFSVMNWEANEWLVKFVVVAAVFITKWFLNNGILSWSFWRYFIFLEFAVPLVKRLVIVSAKSLSWDWSMGRIFSRKEIQNVRKIFVLKFNVTVSRER